MRIIAENSVAIGWTINSFKAGERSACFAVKATYRMQNGAAPVLTEEPEPLAGDQFVDDDPAKSLLYATDFAPLKPRADVLLLATAQVPGKKPAARLNVRLKVGSIDKQLLVFGPRTWRDGILGRAGFNDPKPFVSLPITYENAFGGPSSKKNPVGRGVESEDLPQVEDPRQPIAKSRDSIDPVGFGPIAAGWQARADLAGKYDERWRKERWPWFPENMDYGYFNAAPRDQQIEGFLKGDEVLLFENMHEEHAVYRSRLPGCRTRCFLQERDERGQPRFRDVPLKLDTLWIDLNESKMVLVWRGNVPVRSIKMTEVEQVLAWMEPLSEPPRPASYCPIFIAESERAKNAEWQFQTPEEIAAGEEQDAKAAAELEMESAEFDREMAAADKEATEVAAALEAKRAEEKAALIAQGVDPALLEPVAASQLPSESLRATIQQMQIRSPEDAALLQPYLAEVEQVEAEAAAMDTEFAADFPPAPTRDEVLAAIARRESMAEWDMSGMDLAGQNLSGIDFREASFRKAKLTGANLQKANLEGVDLCKADLSEADLTGANLDGADLTHAILAGARLLNLSLNGTDLSDQNLVGADFTGSSGKRVDFSGSKLSKAKFIGVKLPSADFSKSNLEGSDFRFAEMPRADLDGVKAVGIILEGADLTKVSAGKADFAEGNFTNVKAAGAVFGETKLDRANFTRAILTRAGFSDASLLEAVFDRADLSSATFDGAVLRNAVLTKANLLRAGFDQADLTEVDFRGSNLYEAGFWEAVLDKADFRNANLKGTTLV
jgi:uncharacterized protein YjbI with pentapeptide repeats